MIGQITGPTLDCPHQGEETPYVYNWFLGVQRTLPGYFVVEANYIGNAGRKLISGDGPGGENYDRVAGDLLDGRLDRLNPSFNVVGLAESRVSTSYHGVTLQVSRRHQAASASRPPTRWARRRTQRCPSPDSFPRSSARVDSPHSSG